MNHPPRFPWNHFPPVYIHAPISVVKSHPAYAAAKAGDNLAAMKLVADVMSPQILIRLRQRFSACYPMLVDVRSRPTTSKNIVPNALASGLSALLGWPRERRLIKANNVKHSDASGYSHGGTLANLRGHILAQNAYVIGATVLAGNDYSAELALSDVKLAELRRQHGHIEYWWRQQFGFGFESLTASECRFLSRARTAERICASLGAVAR
jgi:hypothetical protein